MSRWKMFWRMLLLGRTFLPKMSEIVQHFKEDLVESDLVTQPKMVKNVYCGKSFEYKEFKEKVIVFSHRHLGFYSYC